MPLGLRARVTILAGLALALIFLVLGIRELRNTSESSAQAAIPVPTAPVPTLSLATAARAIRTGETITADMIQSAAGDPAKQPTMATTGEVIGKVANLPIPAGATISRTALGTENKLAIRVPIGMRAMSIDTTAEIAVAGLVRPGDRVDVQVVYPGEDAIVGARGIGRSRARTLLQMVQVLAVGDVVVGTPAAGGVEGELSTPPAPARTVTLALVPDQVSALSLAKNTGALYLSLRNPSDQQIADPAISPSHMSVSDPKPVAARAPRRGAGVPAQRNAIELVMGDRRETIFSGGGTGR